MLSRHRHGMRVLAYFGVELLVVAGAFFAAYWIRLQIGYPLDPPGSLSMYLWLLPTSVVVWAGFLWVPYSYDGFRGRSAAMHGFTAAVSSALSILVLFALVTILKRYSVNRSIIGLIGVASFVGLLVTRMVARSFLAHYTKQGYDRHYVIIGGMGEDAVALAETLEAVRGAVFQVRGFVTEDPSGGPAAARWKVLGSFDDLPTLATREPVDDVYLLPSRGTLESYLDLVRRLEAMGVSVNLRLTPFERLISRLELVEASGNDFLRFTTAPRSGAALIVKRVVDFVGAVVLLVALSPLILFMMLLVRATSRGPMIFRQERAGMNGRVFTLYKIRTMVQGAELDREKLESKNELDGPAFKIKEDPRITGLGRFLRKSSIDELPQLWNVIKGDMSLVGPRPLPVYEVEKFEPWQRRRMSMRPGITCLWQISGRNRVVSFSEWMKLDLEYVDRWSLGLDVKILLRTLPAVLGARGAY